MKLPKSTLHVPNAIYGYGRGRMRFARSNGNWVGCRDNLQQYLVGHRDFYFRSRNWENAVSRIIEFEKDAKVKNKAKFYVTDTEFVIYVDLGRWWSANSFRKSIFSAVLKSPGHYFRSAKSKELLNLFKNGYTKPKYAYNNHIGFLSNLYWLPRAEDLVKR
jgi:hypothetical protein